MLVLKRKTNEKIVIDGNITITVLGIEGQNVRIGIDAPQEVRILRSELKGKEKLTPPIEMNNEIRHPQKMDKVPVATCA